LGFHGHLKQTKGGDFAAAPISGGWVAADEATTEGRVSGHVRRKFLLQPQLLIAAQSNGPAE
jgi:hypothetical protein